MDELDRTAPSPESAAPGARERSRVLGANVARLRKEAGINKKTLCLMAGIGRPFLDRIERGEADPRVSVIEDLAAALGTTPQDLIAPPF